VAFYGDAVEPDLTDDDGWSRRIGLCIEAVRTWESEREHEPVEPGSALAGDDAQSRSLPVSTLAWMGISTGIDHLALFADLFVANEATPRPLAPFTVTRAALLGASQAVWLLCPTSRGERVRRASLVAEDERHQHRVFANDYARDPFVRSSFAPESLADLERVCARLRADEAAIRAKLGKGPRLSSTTMMREAAEHLARDGTEAEWLRLALAHEWRLSSAAAHARMWPLHVRPTTSEPLPGGGEMRRLTSSIAQIGTAFAAATMMTSEALRLWDERRTSHD